METERLILRLYEEQDHDDLVKLFTDEEVMKYVGDGVLSKNQAEEWWRKLFEDFYPQDFKIWAVFAKEDSRYIGHTGIYPRQTKPQDWEFVYFLCRNAWDIGFATEIARRIIEYGFEELKLSEVFATVDDGHSVSIHVLEKAGMKFERFEFDEDGQFSVYGISREP